jgi:uncharacterized membrane protein
MRRAAPSEIANVGPLERLLTGLTGGVLLGLASTSKNNKSSMLGLSVAGGGLIFRALSGYCPGYQAMGVDHAHEHSAAVAISAQHGYKFEGEVKIHRAPDEIYAFWRELENLPQVFEHIQRVEMSDNRHSKWTARGPLGKEFSWEAEIFSDKPYELIAWRSVKGSHFKTAGSIHFDPGVANTGTIVRLSLKYDPPGGKVGAAIGELLGEDFEGEMNAGLKKLKELMETKTAGAAND